MLQIKIRLTCLMLYFLKTKRLLKKGPSFIPTRTGINWCDVRKDFTKFVNKIRQFSDVSDQPVQQQLQQQL